MRHISGDDIISDMNMNKLFRTEYDYLIEAVAIELEQLGHDAHRGHFYISRKRMAEILSNRGVIKRNTSLRAATQAITKIIGNDPAAQVQDRRTNTGRWWLFCGKDSPTIVSNKECAVIE